METTTMTGRKRKRDANEYDEPAKSQSGVEPRAAKRRKRTRTRVCYCCDEAARPERPAAHGVADPSWKNVPAASTMKVTVAGRHVTLTWHAKL